MEYHPFWASWKEFSKNHKGTNTRLNLILTITNSPSRSTKSTKIQYWQPFSVTPSQNYIHIGNILMLFRLLWFTPRIRKELKKAASLFFLLNESIFGYISSPFLNFCGEKPRNIKNMRKDASVLWQCGTEEFLALLSIGLFKILANLLLVIFRLFQNRCKQYYFLSPP